MNISNFGRLLCLEKMGPKGKKKAPTQKKGDELLIPVEQALQAHLFEEPAEEKEEREAVEVMESMRIDDKLATFLEDRPYFYDISHELYKNKRRRDEELAALAADIEREGKWTDIYLC